MRRVLVHSQICLIRLIENSLTFPNYLETFAFRTESRLKFVVPVLDKWVYPCFRTQVYCLTYDQMLLI